MTHTGNNNSENYKKRILFLKTVCESLGLESPEIKLLIQNIDSAIQYFEATGNISETKRINMGPIPLELLIVLPLFYHQKWQSVLRDTAQKQETIKALVTALKEAKETIINLTRPPHSFVIFEKLEERDGEIWIRWRRDRTHSSSLIDMKLKSAFMEAQLGQVVRINEYGVAVELLPEFEQEGSVAVISEVTGKERVRLAYDSGVEVLVRQADAIKQEELKVGDKVLLSGSNLAIEKLSEAVSQELLLQKAPNVHWSDIGGLAEEIKLFREEIEMHILFPEASKLFDTPKPKGILIVGPPGNGKTLIVKAAVNETAGFLSAQTGKKIEGYFILINGPADILDPFVGISPRKIKRAFDDARRKVAEGHLVFIVFDEFESLFSMRRQNPGDTGVKAELVTQLNAEMDGIEELDGVVVVGLTNRSDLIDPAVIRPGRFNLKITVPRPNKESAKDILSKYLNPALPIHSKYLDLTNYDDAGNYYPLDREGKRRRMENGHLEHYQLNRDREKIVSYFIDRVIARCYDRDKKENKLLKVVYTNGRSEILTFEHFMSGALITVIAAEAKKKARNRYAFAAEEEKKTEGLQLQDFFDAIDQIFKNEHKLPTTTEALREWLFTEGKNAPEIKEVITLMNGDRAKLLLPSSTLRSAMT